MLGNFRANVLNTAFLSISHSTRFKQRQIRYACFILVVVAGRVTTFEKLMTKLWKSHYE